MSKPAATMKPLRTLLKFPFSGRDWQNRFLIGAGLTLACWVVPIVPSIFVFGYVLRVMREVIQGQEPALPPWEEWGQLAVDGLSAFAICLAYLLPGAVVYLGGMGLYMASTMGMSLTMATAEETGAMLFPPVLLLSMAIMMLSMFLGMLLSMVGSIPLPIAMACYAAEGKLSEAFRLRRIWRLVRDNWTDYVLAWLLTMGLIGASYIGVMVLYASVVLCCLLPLIWVPLGLYMQLFLAGLYGKVYRDSIAQESREPEEAE